MTTLPRTAKPIPGAEARWAALHAVVPEAHRRFFRWIVAMRVTDGTRIDVFAHSWTNRELLLGDDGTAFALTPSHRYKPRPDLAAAVEEALPHRWQWLELGGYLSWDVGPEPCPEDEMEDGWPAQIERSRPRTRRRHHPASPSGRRVPSAATASS